LQADPHIQAPMNSQNYNRYSYVLNNPLSYTDPSGYFFKSLFKAVKKYWRVIAAAVVSVVTYGAASGWAAGWLAGTSLAGSQIAIGAIAGGITGFVGGGIATGSLRGALKGAFSGAVFGAIGGSFKAYGIENVGAQMGIHAVAGGIMSDLQGGKFGHGFFTAGVMKGFGKINFGDMNTIGRTIIQAMVGGTLSKVTGGKFANGAVTAAIQFTVNEKSGWIQEQWNSMKKSFSIIASEEPKYAKEAYKAEQKVIAENCGKTCQDAMELTGNVALGVETTAHYAGKYIKPISRQAQLIESAAGAIGDFSAGVNALAQDSLLPVVPSAAGTGVEASFGNNQFSKAAGALTEVGTDMWIDHEKGG